MTCLPLLTLRTREPAARVFPRGPGRLPSWSLLPGGGLCSRVACPRRVPTALTRLSRLFAGGRGSCHWLTGGSIDPLGDGSAPATESSPSSSSLLFAHKRPEGLRGAAPKSVGPDFGKKRLCLPGDEVDNGAKGRRSPRCVETRASVSLWLSPRPGPRVAPSTVEARFGVQKVVE